MDNKEIGTKERKMAKKAFIPDKTKMSKRDKILYYFATENLIDKRLKKTIEHIRFAYSAMLKEYSRTVVVGLIMTQFQLSEAQAYLVINDAIDIYGDINKADKQGLRTLMTEMLFTAAKKAEERGEEDAILKHMEVIARINGLNNADVQVINMTRIEMPQLILVNNNLDTLKSQMEKTKNPFEEEQGEMIFEEDAENY
jgi:hypothetical protein